jgi:hypothetical protein
MTSSSGGSIDIQNDSGEAADVVGRRDRLVAGLVDVNFRDSDRGGLDRPLETPFHENTRSTPVGVEIDEDEPIVVDKPFELFGTSHRHHPTRRIVVTV